MLRNCDAPCVLFFPSVPEAHRQLLDFRRSLHLSFACWRTWENRRCCAEMQTTCAELKQVRLRVCIAREMITRWSHTDKLDFREAKISKFTCYRRKEVHPKLVCERKSSCIAHPHEESPGRRSQNAHPEERDLHEELGHPRRRLLPGALEDRADERADHFVRYLREGAKFGLACKEDFVRIQILGQILVCVSCINVFPCSLCSSLFFVRPLRGTPTKRPRLLGRKADTENQHRRFEMQAVWRVRVKV